ncbi:hypothetical protein DSECCO2_598990 [anaerobic digester metagenome]
MRKAVSRFVISWGTMVVLLICLYHYASVVEVDLEPPNIQAAEQHNSTVTFSWAPVEYASSYRIYRRNLGGGWRLVEAVSFTTLSYSEQVKIGKEVQYAVRACNISGKRTTLSDYSNPTQIIDER